MKMKYTLRRNGFTLIELLLIISMVSIIGYSFAAVGSSFMTRNFVQNTRNEVVSALRTAQLNALASKNDSKWGVAIMPAKIIIFSGDSYAARNSRLDTSFNYSSSLSVTGTEIVFSKVTGNPNTTPTITISNTTGEIKSVSVNTQGIVNEN